MIFAWRKGTQNKSDLRKRIDAREHKGEIAECPMCGGEVKSTFYFGVWQWLHVKRCKGSK